MKNFSLFICLIAAPLFAQGWEMNLANIRGISASYSYRPLVIFNNRTDYRMFPVHVLVLNLDGKGRATSSSYSSGDEIFGGFGFIVGFSAADKMSPINSEDPFYSSYYRISALDNKKNDVMIIGGDIKIMIPFDFSSEVSIINSYFDITLEGGYMGLSYNAEAGGFGKYVTKKVSEGGIYTGLNVGAKFVFFEFYAGLGGLFGLYKKGIDLEVKDEKISNPPKKTSHFISQAGIGITLDLHARPD